MRVTLRGLNVSMSLRALIVDAALGNLRSVEPPSHCAIVPSLWSEYHADDAGVLLFEGEKPCGEKTVNASPAARELIRFLLTLKQLSSVPQS